MSSTISGNRAQPAQPSISRRDQGTSSGASSYERTDGIGKRETSSSHISNQHENHSLRSNDARLPDAHPLSSIQKIKPSAHESSPAALSISTTSVRSKVTEKLDKPGAKAETKKQWSMPNLLYKVDYSIPAPKGGLTNLTFPVHVDEAQQRGKPGDAGTYFAMQIRFVKENGVSPGVGYIGIQPRRDGKALIIFSGLGSAFTAPQGHSEFDGAQGASNSTLVDFKFGNKYNLIVERNPENKHEFIAYMQDVTDPGAPGKKQEVKRLRVDQVSGLMGPNVGFVEHYGKEINSSSQIPQIRGGFGAPFTTNEDGSVTVGTLSNGQLAGRYQSSLTGNQTWTKGIDAKAQAVDFSFKGMS
ncbi:hypothetical protein [Burkholderia ubonensis]|uniref:hypothetical protein n=1 Tax=Burkholderia ubonensis TaxID=101571 RepID=UPI000A89A2F7|nr:hypothetical protein [Burkholderia ubonensis]